MCIDENVNFGKNACMYFGEQLLAHIKGLGLTPYQIALKNPIDYGLLNRVLNGKRGPSDELLQKLAAIPELKISYETLKAWKLIDEHGGEDGIVEYLSQMPVDILMKAFKATHTPEELEELVTEAKRRNAEK